MTPLPPLLDPCPTAKVKYKTLIKALFTILKWEHGDDGHPRPIRAYRCPFCQRWHLTSQPQREEIENGEFRSANTAP